MSPFVEAAQYQVLFGERPEPQRRYEQARRILCDHQPEIDRLAQRFRDFTRDGKPFGAEVYDEDFLRAYLIHYTTANVCKVQMLLLELARQQLLSGPLIVQDLGVGPGTTALATIDFCLAWANVCDLYGVEFPIVSLVYRGVDANQGCLDFAARAVGAFAEVLLERASSVTGGILGQAVQWACGASWTCCDVVEQMPEVPDEKCLFIASNVLNELSPVGKANTESALDRLAPGSVVVVMEPGDKTKTQELNRWRRQWLAVRPLWSPVAPCGNDHGHQQPVQCDQCWNARRESLHPPLLYQAFWQAVGSCAAEAETGGLNAFKNNLLSWSYVCLLKSDGARHSEDPKQADMVKARRYIGSFTAREPVSYSPDHFDSSPAKGWVEFVKICPGHSQANGVYVERRPGFQVPPLRHGEMVSLDGLTSELCQNGEIIKLIPGDSSHVGPMNGDRGAVTDPFLPGYSERAQRAVDEIAYRLFGFPAMRSFQHRILARVMTGGNILGIAATGGGKSECFILPAMVLPGITIVVSPLKSLMQDQYDQRICDRYGLDHLATYLNGDVPFRERQARLKRLELGHYKLIYMTPEQLVRGHVLDCLQRAHRAVGIRYIALDEAHCISQWGHDFRPSYLNLVRRLHDWGIDPCRIALTATASVQVREDLCEELALNPDPLDQGGDVYVHSSNRHELNLIVRVAHSAEQKTRGILNDLRHLARANEHIANPGAAIVFMPHTGGDPDNTWSYLPEEGATASQRGRYSAGVTPFASFVERALERRVAIYHSKMDLDDEAGMDEKADSLRLGDLTGRKRRSEQNAFITGERDIMVATKGFGMGIDKPNIRLVIHRTPTVNLEAYAQEAGRAGRDGELSNAILYYSPDHPPQESQDSGRQSKSQSDYEILDFFLSTKYVRRDDVIVMWAFLRSVKRKASRYLYFTNDEAIEFFDRRISLPLDVGNGQKLYYRWPTFPERERRHKESNDHAAILDRGYEYEQKTRYLDRILSVLYRIRPTLPSAGKRLALLESVQDTGAQLVRPRLRNVSAILKSNSYFGGLLREHGLSASQFGEWVAHCAAEDTLDFAVLLGLSPSEMAALLNDIKFADGHFDKSGRWQPDLLEFAFVRAPRYGPAAGKTNLSEWRDYAGAKKRANGNARARNQGRNHTILDDWFDWSEVSDSKGWEVLPGPAFDGTGQFAAYLEAFMALHDQRQASDRAAYNRLLTDYVGVDERGALRAGGTRNCLRAVMLGYLKTYEVVEGDNCLSCSRCVPDGGFETDMDRRRNVVKSLGHVVVNHLEALEALKGRLPTQDMTDQLWQMVQSEQEAGHSLMSYVEGWTARLLADQIGHKTALWLRTLAMARGTMVMQSSEFLHNLQQLMDGCTESDLLRIWASVLADGHNLVDDRLSMNAVQAHACHRMGEYSNEAQLWHGILEAPDAAPRLHHDAHEALAVLYAPGAPLRDAVLYVEHSLALARSVDDADRAMRYYEPCLGEWEWARLEEELVWNVDHSRPRELEARLIGAWLSASRSQAASGAVARFVAAGVSERWSPGEMTAVLRLIPTEVLKGYPELLRSRLELEVKAQAMSLRSSEYLDAALHLVSLGVTLPPGVVRLARRLVLASLPADVGDQLKRTYLGSIEAIKRVWDAIGTYNQDPVQAAPTESLYRWLDWFMPLAETSPETAAQLLQTVVAGAQFTPGREAGPLDSAIAMRVRGLMAQIMMGAIPRDLVRSLLLRISHLWPSQILEYVELCDESEPPLEDLADECINALLAGPAAGLRAAVEAAREPRAAGRMNRLDRVARLVVALDEIARRSDIRQASKLTYEHFDCILAVFAPQNDVQCADMAAALVGHLRRMTGRTWLTPVAAHVEVLGYARRYQEVRRLLAEFLYEDLSVTVHNGERRHKISAKRFLSDLEKRFPVERQRPAEESDYLRVVETITQSWVCCKAR